MTMSSRINAKDMHYKELNQQVKKLIVEGNQKIILDNINGHRYIADALEGEQEIVIHGLPGNDLAIFMSGLKITVYANVQDGAANTMNSGLIIVNGSAGDALAYGMRGGEVYIKDDAGYRSGIHMKEYKDEKPALVIGGAAGDFLGEYMAGGIITVLNLNNEEYALGKYSASGMHGGTIYIRGNKDKYSKRLKSRSENLNADDLAIVEKYISNYEKHFQIDLSDIKNDEFFKVIGSGTRPYKKLYVGI